MLIKRKDGSKSKRGLWDNIRAKRGSGKNPTPEMLEQERKIKAADKYEAGGKVWTRKEGQNPKGGLNEKGREAYNRANDANLKAPQPEGGARRDSFCARMRGMKKKLTSAKTANDPDSRINKSLRAWKCKDGGNISKTVLIEIEGKGTPEIHTDKNFNIKNLGSIPHSKGGNVVKAKEGDVVFPTQNSKAKFNKVMAAIKNKDTKTLEKIRKQLPE
jgi:hypothetical protein